MVEGFYSEERRGAVRRMLRKLGAQIREQVERGKFAPVTAEQFLVTLVSTCAFPFIARPMLSSVLGLSPRQFDRFITQRRKHLPEFLKRSFRP